MSDFNKVIIMGRLTAKPELRSTPGGKYVTTLNVASGERFRTKSGEEKEETCFIDVTVWEKQAETCAQYLIKGQKVLVEGRLVMRTWETQAKEKRKTYEIRSQRIVFLEKPKGAAAAADGGSPMPTDNDAPPAGDEDDDIPF